MMIQQILQEKKQLVDQYLAKLLATTEPANQTLYDSMNYSLLAGGKRIRPALFLMALDFLGKPSAAYLDAACAIECIHTYSLIHDDLPQMDNDDYRRGKLTNHKIYGAGMATMAGDGLLTYAFTLLSEMKSVTPDIRCQLIALLARAAGPEGMVGGQAQDIEAEHRQLTMNALRTLDYYKTGRLLCVPLDMASAAANAEHETADAFHVYGLHIGYLFQITDDLLDATGSLEEMGKIRDRIRSIIRPLMLLWQVLPERGNWLRRNAIKRFMPWLNWERGRNLSKSLPCICCTEQNNRRI